MDQGEILRRLTELRKTNRFFGDGRILSSVSTKPTEISLKAYEIFSDVNALDTYVFPCAGVLEREVISWFGELLGNKDVSGYITSGGTEANIAALWAAKKRYPGRRRILVPKSAHYSIEKAADLMGLEIVWIPLDKDFRADSGVIKESISGDTLAVVATAGTSALGVIDPVEEINKLCGDVFFHVDAAFSGFVLPFIESGERIDFGLENIDSVTIDPHKMGFAPIPSGSILFRDESYMRNMEINPSYLPLTTSTLTGSRGGGCIAATWANIKFFGLEGYKRVVRECMGNTRLLCRLLAGVEGVDVVVEPEINFVAIGGGEISVIHAGLVDKGWSILLDRDTETMRVVVMPHVTEGVVRSFVADLREITEAIH